MPPEQQERECNGAPEEYSHFCCLGLFLLVSLTGCVLFTECRDRRKEHLVLCEKKKTLLTQQV